MDEDPRIPIAILGAGGLGRDIAWLIEEIDRSGQRWKVAGFLDKPSRAGERCGRYPILGGEEWLLHQKAVRHVVVAVGNAELRKTIYEKVKSFGGVVFPNLIHPSVRTDWDAIRMGEANIFLEGAAMSVDIGMGNNNFISKLVAVGHDVEIGSHCVINTSTNISGGVKVGDECLLGAGSKILDGMSVASRTLVGIGSCVIQDIREPGTYFGVPARKIAEKKLERA